MAPVRQLIYRGPKLIINCGLAGAKSLRVEASATDKALTNWIALNIKSWGADYLEVALLSLSRKTPAQPLEFMAQR